LFKRTLGILFILLALAIVLGLEKKFQTELIKRDYFDVTKIETLLLQRTVTQEQPTVSEVLEPVMTIPTVEGKSFSCSDSSTSTACVSTRVSPALKTMPKQVSAEAPKSAVITPPIKPTVVTNNFVEIVNPSGFVNSNNLPITIGEYIGKKVILFNIMTYSCSNCQATFPYVNTWYEMYKDDGLIVIGLHTPEFAFEKVQKNVEDAMRQYGITYPVVMDNDYATWNALNNRFWPRKYLIDIYGTMVYDHIGEGAYEETELKIKELLKERKKVLEL
jgi:thiol-disulfide isomerase/thioredoxin